jgi:hypothetical protein
MARPGKLTKADREKITHQMMSRKRFYEMFKDQATAVVSRETQPPKRGNLFWLKNKRFAVREAARRKVCIRFVYKRLKDNKNYTYLIEPYAQRYEKGKYGFRLYFYGYHRTTRQGGTRGIHKFLWMRMYNIVVTRVPFIPRWPVELAFREPKG